MSEVDFLLRETVAELRDGNRIVFQIGDKPEPRLYVDVSEYLCVQPEGDPVPLPGLVGQTVASTSTSSGVLTLEFTDGTTLRCEPRPDVEAWQVVGGDPEYLVVCMPGGEVAVWDARHG